MHDLRRVDGHRRAHVSQLAVPRVFTGVSEVDAEPERAFAVPVPYRLRPFLLSVPARPYLLQDRDALDRVVAELSLSYEEHEEAYENGRPYERYFDLRFGEPGWFDVTREESG